MEDVKREPMPEEPEIKIEAPPGMKVKMRIGTTKAPKFHEYVLKIKSKETGKIVHTYPIKAGSKAAAEIEAKKYTDQFLRSEYTFDIAKRR